MYLPDNPERSNEGNGETKDADDDKIAIDRQEQECSKEKAPERRADIEEENTERSQELRESSSTGPKCGGEEIPVCEDSQSLQCVPEGAESLLCG